MASLEQRIEHIFPSKKRKGPSPIAMVALIFAERRGRWLTQDDVIKLLNKKFAYSTIRKAFKKLSCPLDVLNGHGFIDTELIKLDTKGRPAIKGRLSGTVAERIFELVPSVKEKPPSVFRWINKVGSVEIPPFLVRSDNNGSKWLSPEDILRLREKKIGKKQTNRLLKYISSKGKPYAESSDILKILKRHHRGPLPEHQISIMNAGQCELGSDDNQLSAGIIAYCVPVSDESRKRAAAAGDVPCPSCGNPTHRSSLIRIRGVDKDSCLTEYFESVKTCIHSTQHEDGSWSEMIVGISGMTSEGQTKDECHKKLMNGLGKWIAEKQLNGSSIPPIPPAQLCRLSDKGQL
jgi:predicted RNase H-like HicB family nuclease